MNYIRGSVWLVVLILVIIAVAFILSILPQEIRWILFILSIAGIVIQIVYRSSKCDKPRQREIFPEKNL